MRIFMNARAERTSIPSGRKQKQNIRTIYSIYTKLPILLSNMAEPLRNANTLLFCTPEDTLPNVFP